MTDVTLSEAIKEAYAVAPRNVIIYHTIELNHPAFTQPIRVVQDYQDLTAFLESTGPGTTSAVTFTGFNFGFTKPELNPNSVPQVQLEIDNVDRAIIASIEAAIQTTDMITCTYREYISTDLTTPQNNPPLTLTIMSVTVDQLRVKAVAGFPDLVNKRFPTIAYDTNTYPGLTP